LGVLTLAVLCYIGSRLTPKLKLLKKAETFATDFGVREIVMYNRLDEHVMVSHAAWILAGAPGQLQARQGWHSSHDASSPHWKLFWFD